MSDDEISVRQALAHVDMYVDGETPIHVALPTPAFPTVGHLMVGNEYQVHFHAADLSRARTGLDKLRDMHVWFAFVTDRLAAAIIEAGGTPEPESEAA